MTNKQSTLDLLASLARKIMQCEMVIHKAESEIAAYKQMIEEIQATLPTRRSANERTL